ncbi:Adenylate cyclase [Diplonema papillatum]|nr:Adenylate cyclase [Diplonema papillatum]
MRRGAEDRSVETQWKAIDAALTRFYGRVLRVDDTPETVLRKKLVLTVNLVTFVATTVYCAARWGTNNAFVSLVFPAVSSFFSFLSFATARQTEFMVACNLLAYGGGILVTDLQSSASMGARDWELVVLLLDLDLVASTSSKWTPTVIIASTLIWVTVVCAEFVYRYGLFDLVAKLDLIDDNKVCDCDDPPCPSKDFGRVVSGITVPIAVMCFDYYITRRFANEMRSAHAELQTSVSAAQQVAVDLAAFDLDRASANLSKCSDNLPAELNVALRQILANLEAYKPYLPETLLTRPADIPTRREAPGISSGMAALVFTDIKSSTATWEYDFVAMKQALRTHNRVVRGLIERFDGYEVKTIGDAFMIAFEDAASAVQFALAAQVGLYDAEWPLEISCLPQCAVEPGWNGLRVRIGVHEGPVEVEKNTLSDRFDYFGPTVNKAARLESVCPPGGVAVAGDVLSEVKNKIGDPFVVHSGDVSLHGIGSVAASILSPRKLPYRKMTIASSCFERSSHEPSIKQSLFLTNLRLEPHFSSNPLASVSIKLQRDSVFTPSTAGCILVREPGTESVEEGVHRLNKVLARVAQSLDRSDGTLLSVVGSCVMVGWNVMQLCASHAECACRFASLLQEDVFPLSIGLCTAKHAKVGVTAGRQKFVTALGWGMKLSERVAWRAVERREPVLFLLQATPNELPSSIVHLLIFDATWQVVGFDSDVVLTFSLFHVSLAGCTANSNIMNAWDVVSVVDRSMSAGAVVSENVIL